MRTRAAVLTTCDIKGFTSMSQGMDVDQLGLFLNRNFEVMTEIVFARGGTLDRYRATEFPPFSAPRSKRKDTGRTPSRRRSP